MCNLTYGGNCLSCNLSEFFTCLFGYKLNNEHKGCYEYSDCIMSDEKCVKCKEECNNINEGVQCEGDNVDDCYLLNGNVNNICNEESVNSSNHVIMLLKKLILQTME